MADNESLRTEAGGDIPQPRSSGEVLGASAIAGSGEEHREPHWDPRLVAEATAVFSGVAARLTRSDRFVADP